jgi:hypothetical protein
MPFFVYLGLATPAPGYGPFWFDCPWPVGDNEGQYQNAQHTREINMYQENIRVFWMERHENKTQLGDMMP